MNLKRSLNALVLASGDVAMHQSGSALVAAKGAVSIERGGCGPLLTTGEVSIREGGAQTIVSAREVHVGPKSVVGLVVAPRVTFAEDGRALLASPFALFLGVGIGLAVSRRLRRNGPAGKA